MATWCTQQSMGLARAEVAHFAGHCSLPQLLFLLSSHLILTLNIFFPKNKMTISLLRACAFAAGLVAGVGLSSQPPDATTCQSIYPNLGCVCATAATISCIEISNMYSQISQVREECGLAASPPARSLRASVRPAHAHLCAPTQPNLMLAVFLRAVQWQPAAAKSCSRLTYRLRAAPRFP
jgi:hypothetical protein